MNRRRLLLAAGALAAGFGPPAARAQDAKRVRRIVYFGVRRSDVPSVLRDLEYVSEASVEPVPETMRALLERPAHLIVAITAPVALAAARARLFRAPGASR